MTLAAILGFCLICLGSPSLEGSPPNAGAPALQLATEQTTTASSPAPQPQAPQSPTPGPTQPAPSTSKQAPTSPTQSSHKPPRHHRKAAPCSNSPTALNPTVGNPGDSASSEAGSTTAATNNPGSREPAPAQTGSAKDAPARGSAPLKPCPPPKKVVRDGGSNEGSIQLLGGTPSEQELQASTEQLTAATEENLRKIADRQLSPSQQETVTQIKQFMEQSKTAAAAGDMQRGQNLALKARLLSDELVKP